MPLTLNEKMKFIEDLNKNSDKRLVLYSELFKEIKTQITVLSNNISPEMNQARVPQKIPDKFLLEISKEENTKAASIKPSVATNVPKNNLVNINTIINHLSTNNKLEVPGKSLAFLRRRSKSFLDFDWRDYDENVNAINIPTKSYNSNAMELLNSPLRRNSKSISPSHSQRFIIKDHPDLNMQLNK